jgi:hypothetical protein
MNLVVYGEKIILNIKKNIIKKTERKIGNPKKKEEKTH